MFRRVLLWVPALVVVLAVVGGTGLYAFTGWRARDLAAKAMVQARAGHLPMARLHALSAANLRRGDLAVVRAGIFVESRGNNPAALGQWETIAMTTTLTEEELEEKARLAMVVGSDEAFEQAVAAIPLADAAALRSARALQRGDLRGAINEARVAVAGSTDPEHKIELLRLLLMSRRMMSQPAWAADGEEAGAEEMADMIDQLQGTPEGLAAIALGLGNFPQAPEKSRAWATAALQHLTAANPALLASAQYLVASAEATAEEYAEMLHPVFRDAEVGEQGRFALWLNQHGLWDKTLELVPADRARQHVNAYGARAQALAAAGQWRELLSLSESAANVPASLRLTVRALAAKNLGKDGIAPRALADALRAGAKDGRVWEVLRAADEMDESALADDGLIALCAEPGGVDLILPVARDRFGRRGQFASLDQAFEQASRAAPHAMSVQDYKARREMLAGHRVEPDDTLSRVALIPANPSLRCSHALALLRSGRSAEALAFLQETPLVPEQLAPGDLAVVIAVLEANQSRSEAMSLRASLDTHLLDHGEAALIE